MSSVFQILRNIDWLHSLHSRWYWFQREWVTRFTIQLIRFWRIIILRRIRRKVKKGERVRVLFVESEMSKWKSQSLFALMKADPHYEPLMAIYRRDKSENLSNEEVLKGIARAVEEYKRIGNDCVIVYNPKKPETIDLRQFKPDIVFYQQSWISDGIVGVSRYALTAYIPYYVANYGDLAIDAKMDFHRFVSYYFLLNDAWVSALRSWAPWYYYSGKWLGVGHTMLDYRYLNPAPEPKKQCVIYAPHFSFITPAHDNLTGISTFPKSGKAILEYAKAHPSMNWVFKPHPVLWDELVVSGLMTEKERADYYDEWKRIGLVCTNGNYVELFNDATCMITDCGSFLTEFGATGKPIVHLISSAAKLQAMAPSRELYATYYQVHNISEMYTIFKCVLEERNDPKKEERLMAVKEAGLNGNYAAMNIMKFFGKEFQCGL